MFTRFFLITLLTSATVSFSFSQHQACGESKTEIKYIENKGQWEPEILFQTDVNAGNVYLEKDGFTFAQYSPEDLKKRGQVYHENRDSLKYFDIKAHAWKVVFENSNALVRTQGIEKRPEYHNYFIGNDSQKWASNVGLFNAVTYDEIYDGVVLKAYSDHHNFKYDFIVAPNANASQISLRYSGLDAIYLENENLVLQTSIGNFQEMKPYAYQLVNGVKKEVKCNYFLNGKVVQFEFPNGYNKNLELVIDPVLIASTLSGTTGFSDNYGHGATFDNLGNIYTGAINFGGGYPATVGAFQLNFAGGGTDIVLSKLSPNGSALIYATYIGGNDAEYPHSLIVSDNNELYVYGTTASTDYPCSAGAYDNTFGGGTDIILTHFNSTGTALIGSTYLGGANMDGNNSLTLNYGDNYRGEIILDATGACYVAACAGSGFPTTAGAYQTVFGGGMQDAVFLKMNSTLSSLVWSTYLGGTGEDSGFGLRLDASGDVYACGGTNTNFLNANGYQTANQGGVDGFVVKITNNGASMPNRTYLGNLGDDVLFFLDIDNLGRINVYGHNFDFFGMNTFTATPGTYNVAGSGQHIACFNTALTTLEFLSVIGGGNTSEFVPIAFMVDVCGNIYFSGHSATFGLPTGPSPLFTTGGFYVGALSPNAATLNYATYYTGDHVDGGTSRFDPQGTIYQGVCSGGGFNTTANAYSPNQATFWDIGVFKIDFEMQGVMADASVSPNASGCAPFTVNFTNSSTGAANYSWDFDDGSAISTVQSPSHTFTTPGVYDVMFVAINAASCNLSDTLFLQITVVGTPTVNLGPDTTFCQGSVTLDAGPLGPYLWSTGATSQTINVSSTGTYSVQVGAVGCQGSDAINVTVSQLAVNIGADIIYCDYSPNFPIVLDAGIPGATYLWSTGGTNQTLSVSAPGTYSVTVDNGVCTGTDAILIQEISGNVSFNYVDTIGCAPLTTSFFSNLNLSGTAVSYAWDFGDGGTSNLLNPSHNYSASGVYTVSLDVTTTGGCIYSFSKQISIVINPQPLADFNYSPALPVMDELIYLTNNSQNATDYHWYINGVSFGTATDISFLYNEGGGYEILLAANNGTCTDTAIIFLDLEEELIFYVPNTFTPDDDQYNQQFKPVFTSGFDPFDYQLLIFNRWGEIIFESFNSEVGWNGTYGGNLVQDGTYTWKIIFKEESSDRRRLVLGHVSLIR